MNGVTPSRRPAPARARSLRRQVNATRAAAGAGHRRARAVGGEVQRGRGARQPLAPPASCASSALAGQPPALPGGEVRVLHPRLGGSGDGPPRAKASYSADSSRTRTPVDHPSQTMWCTSTAAAPSRRPPAAAAPRAGAAPAARSNGRGVLPAPPGASAPVARLAGQAAQVQHRERRRAPRGGTSCTGSPPSREDGAQRLVAPHDLGERAPQRGTSSSPRSRTAWDVVGGVRPAPSGP